MKTVKLSERFSGSQEPWERGVYRRFHGTGGYRDFSYWTPGFGWGVGGVDEKIAEKNRDSRSAYQPWEDGGEDFEWQGLATKPK